MPDPRLETGTKPDLEPQPHGGALKRTAGPGRPKGTVSLVEELRRKLNAEPQLKDEIMQALVESAKGGDMQAMKIMLDRIDGPVATKLEGDGALVVRVVRSNDQAEEAPRRAEESSGE